MSNWFARAAVVALALTIAAPASADPDTPVRAADYAAAPAIEDPILSPDGAHVAARAMIDGRAQLSLYDALDPARLPVRIALPIDERLDWHCWVGASRLVVSLTRDLPVPVTRLASIDIATGTLRPLGAERAAGGNDAVLHIDRQGRFLLLQAQPEGTASPAVYRVDLASGAMEQIVAPRDHVWDWFADSAGTVRAGMGIKGGRSWMLYRKGENERFARSVRGAGDINSGIEQFVPVRGSDQGYAMAEGPDGRTALYAYDFRKSRLGALVYADPEVDIDGFQTGPDGELLGVEYTRDRPATRWFDAASQRRQAGIDAALPGRVNRVVSASAGKSRLVVLSESARDAGAYYLFAGGRADLLGEINPALRGVAGSEMRAIEFRARDGLRIGGYLTLPAGRDPHALPLIVMPHGGPFARDSWGYDPWAQYLAAKGYAVLQPNFRGSTGFGRALIDRGAGEWGRGMQNDIDDSVAWAAAQGIVDADRVCIMGASFGGYAAMWAAVKNPGTYRCAISFAGISDLRAQLDFDHQTFDERDFRAWRHRIQGNAPSLESLSPIRFVDRLRMPILIAHGAADETVPPDQSVRLHQALTRLGRAHDYVAYPGEGHNLQDPADTADFLGRVGRFLDAHNPS